MYTMQSNMHSKWALWKSLIWPGQRSCTWPIFKLHLTLDLKYICAKFHHSTSNRSGVYRENGRTDRHTNRQTDIYKTIAWSILVVYLLYETLQIKTPWCQSAYFPPGLWILYYRISYHKRYLSKALKRSNRRENNNLMWALVLRRISRFYLIPPNP